MKTIRQGCFETNSSSTHSLTIGKEIKDYVPEGKYLMIDFVYTDEYSTLTTLKEKVSYLVSQIINNYKYNAPNYKLLIEEVENAWSFKRIKEYVKENFDKEIVFPDNYEGDIEDIVNINHQLVMHGNLDDLLNDIVNYDRDLLCEVLNNGNYIKFGSD